MDREREAIGGVLVTNSAGTTVVPARNVHEISSSEEDGSEDGLIYLWFHVI